MQYSAGRHVVAMALCACTAASAWAQQGIYTCVDAKGRRITADRPIVECIDREQSELTPSGTVRRKIGPSLTADERAAEDARAAKALEERNRVEEEKKRQRALITRYPDRATHEKERAISLAQLDDVIAAANKHTNELEVQRRKLEVELEFFRNDPSKVPFKLKRQVDENNQQMEVQRRFIANQEQERKRVIARYDEELGKLSPLWAQLAVSPTKAAAASAAVKR